MRFSSLTCQVYFLEQLIKTLFMVVMALIRSTIPKGGSQTGVELCLEYDRWGGDLSTGDKFISIENVIGTALEDVIFGSSVNNHLESGDGSDWLHGFAGDDTLDSGNGIDHVDGDEGNDTIYTGDGDDKSQGGGDNDTIYAGAGNDTSSGGDGSDKIYAGDGDDTVSGDFFGRLSEGGNDWVYGEDGNDVIYGGGDKDVLSGGNGDDKLIDGIGGDTLTGGEGKDTFLFAVGSDSSLSDSGLLTWITDFNRRDDQIDVSQIDANRVLSGRQELNFIDNAAFSGAAGEFRFGGTMDSLLGTPPQMASAIFYEADTDGDRKADFAFAVTTDGGMTLDGWNFKFY